MTQDIVGDVRVALRSARSSSILSGGFGGVPFPPYETGKFYMPHWAVYNSNNPITITANRLYRTWIWVDKTTTFLGGWFFNSGVGDNTKNVRIGVWDATGVLKKDFGQTTLTGASLVRSAANTVTLQGPAWYKIGLVSDTAPALYAMGAADDLSNAGFYNASLAQAFGTLAVGAAGTSPPNTPCGDYAAFVYAALPDPITAATTTLLNGTTSGAIPLMGLYL